MTQRSKRKLTLKLLEYAADEVAKVKDWPTHRYDIDRASADLAKMVSNAVIDNTWDASSLEDWQYDPGHQRFTFDVSSVFRMGGDITSRPVRIKSRFHFDPKADLLAELDRVSDEIKAYSDNLLLMQRAYHDARKDGRGTALDD